MKRAIVTGASSGIGAAVARLLVARGIEVAMFDREPQGAEAIAAESPALASAWAVDVTREDQVEHAVALLAERWGGIDFLVNCAGGGGRGGALLDMSLTQWESRLALNLTSAFLLIRAVGRVMRRNDGGAIVNVASLAATKPSPVGGAAYSAAKAGLLALSRQSANELASDGIRVNAVSPGPSRKTIARNPSHFGS